MLSIKNITNFSLKENLVSCSLVVLIFILDRVSKIKVINSELIENNLYINDYINFDLVWNTGIGFGLLSSESNLSYNLISIAIFFVIVFVVYMAYKSNFVDKMLLSMIIGGALGNFYDRVTFSAVPDFIDIHYGNFHWFTFNIADIFISIGILILISKDVIFKK